MQTHVLLRIASALERIADALEKRNGDNDAHIPEWTQTPYTTPLTPTYTVDPYRIPSPYSTAKSSDGERHV